MAELKQYVNLDPGKPIELKEIPAQRAGRVITLVAKLNKKQGGVPVVFDLIAGPKNHTPLARGKDGSRKTPMDIRRLKGGLGMPGIFRKRVATDDNGEAKVELHLSGFGGDEFEVKAYLLKPGGKKGKELLSEKYIVWRRIYYQVGRFKSGAVGANRKGNLPEIPNFDWAPVKTEFEARKHHIELVDDSRADLVNRYKNILVPEKPYNDLLYSVKNGYVKEREPVSLRVVLCNMISTPEEKTRGYNIVLDRKSTDIDVSSIGELWQDESLPIGTDCIISAHVQFHEKDTPRPINGIFMYGVGPSTIRIRFDLMEQSVFEASFGKKPTRARLILELRLLAQSTNGLSWYNAVWLAHNFMHGKTPYTPGGKQSTAIHELGHFVDMVNPRQQTWYVDHGHQGPHCSTGISKSNLAKLSYGGLGGTCVMFGEGDPLAKKVNKFCSTCDPSVRESNVRNPQRIRNWP